MRLLVSGTTGGIGSAMKRVAEENGHEVVEINRVDFDRLESREDVENIDALVFATGMCPVKPLTQFSDAEFAATLEANCGLFVRLMRFIVRHRRYAATGMRAVAVSSVSAVEGWPGGSAYCASKGALSAVCRALDVELKSRKISVCAVEPRHVRTKMFDNCAGRMGVDPASARDPDELAREMLAILLRK